MTKEQYRKKAQAQCVSDDAQIAENARVSKSINGAWVQAWVWVYDDEGEE
jgi:hypothetical protein